jgi:Na+/H+ antiporter NhaA
MVKENRQFENQKQQRTNRRLRLASTAKGVRHLLIGKPCGVVEVAYLTLQLGLIQTVGFGLNIND